MLVFIGTRPEDLQEGDLIAFDYANPGQNQISRCGVVENFKGTEETRCLVVYDYSLQKGGAGYRNYRLSNLRGLGVIVEMSEILPPLHNLTTFTKKLVDGGEKTV